MKRRVLLCVCLAALPGGCGDGEAETARRPPMGTLPAWTAGQEGVLVSWVVRPEQLIACETAAYQLRAWRARFGPAVALSVVTDGSDPELVRTFLRAQRLSDVPVRVLAEQEFRSTFGALAGPSLFILRNGRIRGRMSASRPALLDPIRVRGIEFLIDSLVAAREPEAPRSITTSISRG